MLENKTTLSEVEKKLVAEYATNETEIKRLTAERKRLLSAISEQAPHKRGDVIKWTETGRRKNVGSWLNPRYVDIADSERKGVVRRVSPWMVIVDGKLHGFGYEYSFVVLKKDGSIGVNEVYVNGQYEWTGEHVDLNNN